jgi:hypothetical protein
MSKNLVKLKRLNETTLARKEEINTYPLAIEKTIKLLHPMGKKKPLIENLL